MAACYKCGHELPARERIFRATLCESCGSDLRVCRNCGFYLPGAHWDCRETVPEAVREKDRANFCEFFRPATGAEAKGQAKPGDGSADNREEKARDQLNNLFGDS
ncbi:MAG: 60S ribosomal export protein NMD3 [Spirochaetales bacterium]|nr:60S ribosomal export protein NMD3 [Spirochaetales bacterium]